MRRSGLLACSIAAMAATLPGTARAQNDSTFSVQLLEPAPGPDNFLNVEGTRIGSDFFITGGALFHYQYRPLAVFDCAPGTGGEGQPACDLEEDPRVIVVEHQVAGDLLFGVGFLKLFSAGLAIPVTFWQTGEQLDFDSGLGTGNDLPSAFAMGDMRLHLKFRFFPFMEGDMEGFGVALAPIVSFPLGSQFDSIPSADKGASGSFLGDGFLTVTARVIADFYQYPFHAAAQFGYHWREDSQLYSSEMGHELVYGGAFGWWVIPELQIFVEAHGRNGFTTQIDQTPLEIDAAVRYRVGPVLLTGGGGAGILRAVGVPEARGFLGVSYQPFEEAVVEDPDRDDDGYLNDDDGCPDDAEDFDEFQDADGCPEPDNDEDGVLDAFDACLMIPEDVDGYKDEDGCPDLDHDEDGIDTPADQCPDDPEDFDGWEDEDGCPDNDNDADGIPDLEDACSDDPEDFDGFQDDDGCPDPDNDLDGVPDEADECPDRPETLNGVDDEDGCPDRGTALVVVTETRIEIRQQVNFATDSDRIVGERSFQILDVVATVLRGNPHIRIEVQGHTDSRGDYDHNIDLSGRRAEAVRTYLIEKGIDPERMTARGYGPDVPIADNRTRDGRAKNRRVEFHILPAAGVRPTEEAPAPDDAMEFAPDEGESVNLPPPGEELPLPAEDVPF